MTIEGFNELPDIEQLKVIYSWLGWLQETQWDERLPRRMLNICKDLVNQRILVEQGRMETTAQWECLGAVDKKLWRCSNCGDMIFADVPSKRCSCCRREMVVNDPQ